MPQLDSIPRNPKLDEDALTSHLIRLRNDIAQFEAKLKAVPASATKDHPTPEAERQTIEAGLAKWRKQLYAAEHPGVTEGSAKAEVGVLKSELDSLRKAFADVVGKFTAAPSQLAVPAEESLEPATK